MSRHPSKHDTLSTFDIATVLDSDEAIAEYLSQVIEDADGEEFIRAPGHIAKARGMTEIAEKSGLGHEASTKHCVLMPLLDSTQSAGFAWRLG
jgi:probable addiction module antidote protein